MARPKKLSPVDFCIMVLWINGMTTGQIFKYFAMEKGKSQAAIRGVINRIHTRRDRMTKEDRQKFLDAMKEARIDGGKLEAQFFVARSMDTDAMAYGPPARKAKVIREKKPEPDLKTRKGRREARALKKQEDKEKAELTSVRALREMGGAPRGPAMHPLEFLSNSRMLNDDWRWAKGTIDKGEHEAIRKTSGEMLRIRFNAAMLSGVKSQSYEIMGTSSGKGYTITFRMMQANRDIEAIRKMLGAEKFNMMERLLRYEECVWLFAKDVDAALEDIRRGLDVVSLYDRKMQPEYFERRWGKLPDMPKAEVRLAASTASSAAREIIEEAQRKVR